MRDDASASSPSVPPPDQRIALGVIRKPHGVRGEASVEPWTDSPVRFSEIHRVFAVAPDESQHRVLNVHSVRLHGERVLVLFDDVSTPEEVRTLSGWTIEIPRTEARPLEENEYFLHDLEGLTVIASGIGAAIGRVRSVAEGGGGVLLEIEKSDRRTFELPFAADFIGKVDLERKTIEVSLPEGIDDLSSIPAVEDEPRAFGSQDSGSGAGPAPEQSGPDAESGLPNADSELRIDIVTIFPSMFEALLNEGVVARGIRGGILDVKVWDLRDFTNDKHRSTDDEAYGGGAGMVMLADPIFRCLDAIRADGVAAPRRATPETPWVVMLTPQGDRFTQNSARTLAGRRWIVLLCGRYEGFDERILSAVDEELSIGDFVVSGGEIPAMLVADAVSRMVEGVVGTRNSVEADSFYDGLLDYPHYTRPAEVRGLEVPEVLLSGHAENIRKWRKRESLRATLRKRPDLLEVAELDDEAKKMLADLKKESPPAS